MIKSDGFDHRIFTKASNIKEGEKLSARHVPRSPVTYEQTMAPLQRTALFPLNLMSTCQGRSSALVAGVPPENKRFSLRLHLLLPSKVSLGQFPSWIN